MKPILNWKIYIRILQIGKKKLQKWGSTVFFFFFFFCFFLAPVFQWCCSTPKGSPVVSVESSSLLYHSIYLWFICFPRWSIIGELENLHADRTTVCFEPWQKLRARLGTRKTGLNPPHTHTHSIFILTVPRRYFCCGSLLLLVLAVRIYTLVRLLS